MGDISEEDKRKRSIKELLDLVDERNNKGYNWFKYSMGILGTILGLIISLKTSGEMDCVEYWLFSVAIGLGALAILCGLTYLYSDTDYHSDLVHKKAEDIFSSSSGDRLLTSDPKWIFGIARSVYFYAYGLAVVFLVIFSVVSNHP